MEMEIWFFEKDGIAMENKILTLPFPVSFPSSLSLSLDYCVCITAQKLDNKINLDW
jgi:hypothetical protein